MREFLGDNDDVPELTAFMRAFAAEPIGGSPPKAAFVWWKAQLARRWDAEHRAAAAVRLDECICVGLAALGATGLAAWRWTTSPGIAAPVAGAASIAGVLVLLTTAVFAVADVLPVIRRSGGLKSPDHQITN
jgi:hypothetical protein